MDQMNQSGTNGPNLEEWTEMNETRMNRPD